MNEAPKQGETTDQGGFPPGLVSSTSFLVSKLGHLAKSRTCEMLQTSENLTPSNSGIIFSLAEYGPASQRELADRLHFDASDVVALVDELEKRGWAERKIDPTDRRRYAVTLTAQGLAAHERLAKAMREVNEELLATLDASERSQLHGLLHRLLVEHDDRFKN